MFNLSTIYIFIPVKGCVGGGANALLCPGVYNAVKTALTTADIFIEDQLLPPLDMVTIDQEREMHKPNNWTM